VTADAGLLVPPGHAEELARALGDVIDRSDMRVRFSAGARRVRDRLPTWDHSARRMSEALERVSRS
jgi:glycosyltransferase involved in cell wall biosynthesis